MNDARTRRVEIRTTPEEYETMASNARIAGLTMTAYIVDRCVYDQVAFELRGIPGWDAGDARARRACRHSKGGSAKTAQIHVRCTSEEREIIERRAQEAGATLSDYVVASALGNRIERIVWNDDGKLAEALHELKKQGVNLNQIAYALNKLNVLLDDPEGNEKRIEKITEKLISLPPETQPEIALAAQEVQRVLATLARARHAGR